MLTNQGKTLHHGPRESQDAHRAQEAGQEEEGHGVLDEARADRDDTGQEEVSPIFYCKK